MDIRFTLGSKQSPLQDLMLRALQETGGGWNVASMRAPGFRQIEQVEEADPLFRAMQDPRFRALAPLPERAQIAMDTEVQTVGMQRLTFVSDLLAEGLTYKLTDPLSVTFLEHYGRNRTGRAQRVMTPSARTENKMTSMLPGLLPVFLTIDGFEIDIRTLKMSQRINMPLDTALIGDCVRSTNEAIEDQGINGATTLDGQELKVGGYAAPGLLNAPNANTGTIVVAWNNAAGALDYSIGPKILADIQAGIAALQADNKYGPYNVYVGTGYGNALNNDFKAGTAGSIISRVQELEYGGRRIRIKLADFMPLHKVAIVQMTKDVVDVVDGQRPTVIPWTSLDGFTIHNLVMAIMIVRFRSDPAGQSGVYIATHTP